MAQSDPGFILSDSNLLKLSLSYSEAKNDKTVKPNLTPQSPLPLGPPLAPT